MLVRQNLLIWAASLPQRCKNICGNGLGLKSKFWPNLMVHQQGAHSHVRAYHAEGLIFAELLPGF